MHIVTNTTRLAAVAALTALIAAFAPAQAQTIYHDSHASFAPIANSASTDGWNQLNRAGLGCADSTCSTALLVAGITANVWNSGDAVLQRVSGGFYPAGFGLYGDGTLTFTDTTVAAGVQTLVFQGVINNFGTPLGVTLNLNGGTQALLPTTTNFVDTGTVADVYTYTFDLSGLAQPLTSYQLSLSATFAQALAFQVDQVSAVPETGTLAMMLAGVGVMGVIGRRKAARQA